MNGKRYIVNHCGIVVLAAGESRRLGSPKQLLVYHNKSLVRHTVETALQTGISPVIVVVGANSDLVEKQLEELNVDVVKNKDWKQGMASSLHCGLIMAQKKIINLDGIIFMVCDQPYVNLSVLESLLQCQKKTGKPIVASSYEGRLGTPALFHKSFFAELLTLNGDTGAKKLIRRHKDQAASILFPGGIVDIDTREDFELLLK